MIPDHFKTLPDLTMNSKLTRFLHRTTPAVAAALAVWIAVPVIADSTPTTPTAVDLGTWMPPQKGGEFVEVNLRDNLLGMAARIAAKDQPEVSELLNGIRSIRVHVIGLDDSNRSSNTEHVQSLRKSLDASGWERVVSVTEADQEVAVHLRTQGSEAVQGLVVTVLEGKHQAVVVHISGDIRPEKLATLGEKFGIEPLKHLPIPAKKQEESKAAQKP
jgi:hypothetical protein